MTRHRPRHPRGITQAPPLREDHQQQQQLLPLQGLGAQFSSADASYDSVSQALKAFPEHPQVATPQLRAVLGRTATSKNDLLRLLNSDVVASLSSEHQIQSMILDSGEGRAN